MANQNSIESPISSFLLIITITISSYLTNATETIEISKDIRGYYSIPPSCSQPSDPDDVRIHDKITQMMNETKIKSVWLPIVRINLTKWTWMDGTVQGNKISNAAQPGRDCAVMRVREQFIDDVYCNDTYNLVICEFKGDMKNNNCTTCMAYQNKTYSVYDNRDMTWFVAKQYCTQQNQTLAVFRPDEIQAVINLLTPVFKAWSNKNAWIGLRLTEYYIQTNNGNMTMSHYFWGARGPCPCPEKKCVLMKMSSEGMYHWVPAKNTEKHNYLCNKKGITGSPTPNYANNELAPTFNILIIILISSGVLVIVMILISAVFLYCKCVKKATHKNGQMEMGQHDQPVQGTPSMSTPQTDHKKEPPDCVDLNDVTTNNAAKGTVNSEPSSPDKRDLQSRSTEGTTSHQDTENTEVTGSSSKDTSVSDKKVEEQPSFFHRVLSSLSNLIKPSYSAVPESTNQIDKSEQQDEKTKSSKDSTDILVEGNNSTAVAAMDDDKLNKATEIRASTSQNEKSVNHSETGNSDMQDSKEMGESNPLLSDGKNPQTPEGPKDNQEYRNTEGKVKDSG